MRIGIIGSGFFGHHIAAQLNRVFPVAHVEMFEKEESPLLGAGTMNQCRLHQGFHYPRSGYTIYQSIMGYDRFRQMYGDFLEPVPDNLYAVHHEGLVDVDQYRAVMDSFHLNYEMIPVSPKLFRKPEEIDAVMRVEEMAVNVKALRARLSERFSGRMYRSTHIDEVDSISGFVRSGSKEYGPFDYLINATYTNPNLGLPEELHFPLKWEMAAMVLAETSLPRGTAVTIMDGSYVSVYPAYDGLHTLSSVHYTPMRHYNDAAGIHRDYDRRYEMAEQMGARQCIGEDVMSFLDFEYEVKDLWVTAKTKLSTDTGDSRVTEIRRDHRLLSVLCGKLDAVFEASDGILREIR